IDGENIWIGYNVGNGFSKYSVKDNQFTHYHPEQKDLSNSNAGTINVISKDLEGNLWIGTHGGGIFQFDQKTNSFQNFQQHHGLKSNYINSILPDHQGNLWISSVDGMNYFTEKTQSIIPLEIDLVLEGNDFIQNGLSTTDNKLYFFSNNEFVEIEPSAYRPSLDFPNLVISSFKVFDKEFPLYGQTETQLSYQENFFTIQFSSIKAHPLKKVNYAYKLEGFDKEWISSGIRQEASYTNVPHGEYSFKIKATNESGTWSDVLVSYTINIKPPYWRTWWFVLLCLLLLGGLIYSVYRYRIIQLQRIHSIKNKISQDLHDEVGSMLSSINVYSSIASKSLDNTAIIEKALTQITQNSRQVMENMSDIVWAINSGSPGTTTLEDKLKNYGYELLTPLNINVTYSIAVDADKKLNHIEARKNILLIAKEGMNNIARYSGATDAMVKVDINHKVLTLHIRDNGKGFDLNTNRKGNGLYNMRHRTVALGGIFAIRSEENQGTSIKCTIPVTSISNT
ncbi:MAG: histidine kinase, partial [Bacteroidota bacterium]|nr:histidine kinase [Bacteroidota bacterium]